MSEINQETSHHTPPKIAVIGCGYLGKFHAEKYYQLPNCELHAIIDSNSDSAKSIAEQYNVIFDTHYQNMAGQIDAVSIVTPTSSHYEIAKFFLNKGAHVLIEKPITVCTNEADELIEIAKQNQLIIQVGHLERFNAAILSLEEILSTPKFIETHRLAPFKPRSTDVNVILDLMIHDIDIILNLVKDEVIDIVANGTSVLSNSIDIANARLTFANGCVANVTASRVSFKTERKMRIFQHDAYISVDFQNRILSHHFKDTQGPSEELPKIKSNETTYEDNDALKTEINSFIECITQKHNPIVTAIDGKRALDTALKITRLLDHQ